MSQQFYEFIQKEKKTEKHPAYRYRIPFSAWQTRTLEILQTVFSPMYKNVWEQNWNNNMFATMTKPYYHCNFEEGVYEIYVPTTIDAFGHMHYWRIIVKVYQEIDGEQIEKNQKELKIPYIKPVGIIDSETICHLAMTTTPEHRHKLKCLWKAGGRKAWFKGLLRGFRHSNKRGYFTPIVVHQSPDIAVKRLLSLLYNFLKKRIVALLKKLKLQEWMFNEYLEKRQHNSLLMLLEHYSVTMRTITKSFLETFDWVRMKLKDLYAEIGRQNVQKTKIKPLIKEIREVVSVFRRQNTLKNIDIPDPPLIKQLITVLNS